MTFKSNFVNCSLVLPLYRWIVRRSSSRWATGVSGTGVSVDSSPSVVVTSRNSANADERFERCATACSDERVVGLEADVVDTADDGRPDLAQRSVQHRLVEHGELRRVQRTGTLAVKAVRGGPEEQGVRGHRRSRYRRGP